MHDTPGNTIETILSFFNSKFWRRNAVEFTERVDERLKKSLADIELIAKALPTAFRDAIHRESIATISKDIAELLDLRPQYVYAIVAAMQSRRNTPSARLLPNDNGSWAVRSTIIELLRSEGFQQGLNYRDVIVEGESPSISVIDIHCLNVALKISDALLVTFSELRLNFISNCSTKIRSGSMLPGHARINTVADFLRYLGLPSLRRSRMLPLFRSSNLTTVNAFVSHGQSRFGKSPLRPCFFQIVNLQLWKSDRSGLSP
ncbi:hypothetical protein KOR42_55130 [Thalassoglobus neptunius]|uniref:Uncharacterized protein n=1 Tax=Thalassoglobus neptunius TaxID=1938619 RepID=A0A5C5UU10_9PLAN|nr:hypothetical protein KOR42_55130 [Thalassoglobus neptunius]